jgi:hypothetical protein
MNCTTLELFRQQTYACFDRRGDALFNLCDALVSEPKPAACR